jgi:Protein of unknown function (DUF3592)
MAKNGTQVIGRGVGCAGFLFCSFLCGMLCLILYSIVIEPVLLLRESKTWPEVPCVIQEVSVEDHTIKGNNNNRRRNRNRDSTGYSPEVRFEYVINGQEYSSDRFWFDQSLFNTREEAQAKIQPYTVGGESICYVNPKNANEAVLVREGQTTNNVFMGAFFGVFVLFTGVGSVASFWILIRPKPAQAQAIRTSRSIASTGTTPASDGNVRYIHNSEVCPIESDAPDEPLVLKQEYSRTAAAIGAWIFALLWNGFIWGFLFLVMQKNGPWFPLIILGLFAFIGLLIFWLAISKTLQIWNPVTTVICSQRNLYPGSEFEISWLHQGNTAGIKKFTIALESEESVTYRQGTSTRTETNRLFEKVIVESSEQTTISQGFTLVELPIDAMHTFRANRNKIKWIIRVKGTIAFWPDIDDTYEITVYPPKIVEQAHA